VEQALSNCLQDRDEQQKQKQKSDKNKKTGFVTLFARSG
jgi:hypothetical protein